MRFLFHVNDLTPQGDVISSDSRWYGCAWWICKGEQPGDFPVTLSDGYAERLDDNVEKIRSALGHGVPATLTAAYEVHATDGGPDWRREIHGVGWLPYVVDARLAAWLIEQRPAGTWLWVPAIPCLTRVEGQELVGAVMPRRRTDDDDLALRNVAVVPA